MASSNVVVIDPRARRIPIKVTPARFLSDVLEEACTKLGLQASQYTFKHNKKQLDLSCPMRLSGLSPGAKLELVQLSNSPSVVTVALQIPVSETIDPSKTRSTCKFPSTTTLWHVLRRFEYDAPGKNFTARGVPQMNNGASDGAGRLFYEAPVIQVMGRELSSFTDLQKTLRDLGFNTGNVLLRLGFRRTEQPLEEAMVEIEQYFKDMEVPEVRPEAPAESTVGDSSVPGAPEGHKETEGEEADMQDVNNGGSSEENPPENDIPLSDEPVVAGEETVVGPQERPILVYAPPTNSTPQAATFDFNAADYEPTVDHAKLHQARLTSTAQNRRLLSDAEVAAKQRAASERLAGITNVEIKVRYPDLSQVVSKFTSMDTASDLYNFVASTLQRPNEPFSLSFASPKGPRQILRDDKVKLIKDLGFEGRMLVNLAWDEGASLQTRSGNTLKEEYAKVAREMKVQEIKSAQDAQEQEKKEAKGKGKEKDTSGEPRKGLPKWLKLPGKK